MSLDTDLEHLYALELPTPFPVGPVTVYLGLGPGEPPTLVDTGPATPETRAALEAGLGCLGCTPADLGRIVVTHAHADHFGLAGDLAAISGAEVLTHPWNVEALGDHEGDRTQRTAFYAGLLQQAGMPVETMLAVGRVTRGMGQFARPVAVSGSLEEGDHLRLAGRTWQVLHTPGHAAGLICLYEAESRTLLSSDHLLADISSNPLIEPPRPGQAERPRSLVLYMASLRRVAAMEIERALPSHGPVIKDVAGLVAERLAFHQRRMARVLEAIGGGARTTWEVTEALFPDRSPLDNFLAVSETIGHLDLLEMEGLISGQEVEGVIYWALGQVESAKQ